MPYHLKNILHNYLEIEIEIEIVKEKGSFLAFPRNHKFPCSQDP